jgi:hypothetical protein
MPFDFDYDAMFKACCGYLSNGLKLVKLHGIHPDGSCTCGNPDHRPGHAGERSIGKHPIGTRWGEHAASEEDEIIEWCDQYSRDKTPFNVGVLLGEKSKVIDTEDDTDEARNYKRQIGLDKCVTPTFTSGRSEHKLLRWSDEIHPSVGVSHIEGLEVRVGNSRKQVQSVLPPSWHWSGVQYTWAPTLSIDQLDDFAPIPVEIMRTLRHGKEDTDTPQQKPAKTALFSPLEEGSRHAGMLRLSVLKVMSTATLSESTEQCMLQELQMTNLLNCKPPKTPNEIRQIFQSTLEYRRRKEDRGWRPGADITLDDVDRHAEAVKAQGETKSNASGQTEYQRWGLSPTFVGSVQAWTIGEWSLRLEESDPRVWHLSVPAWEATACQGVVRIPYEDLVHSKAVAKAVWASGSEANLYTPEWFKIWNGSPASKKSDGKRIEGLCDQLLKARDPDSNIRVGTSSLRYATLAGYLWTSLNKATSCKDIDKPEPHENGRACLMPDGCVLFQWTKVWEEIGDAHDVAPSERQAIRQRLLGLVGTKDFIHVRTRLASGKRVAFVSFDKIWLDALQALSVGEK